MTDGRSTAKMMKTGEPDVTSFDPHSCNEIGPSMEAESVAFTVMVVKVSV
jgi:hypothetical protein